MAMSAQSGRAVQFGIDFARVRTRLQQQRHRLHMA